MVAANWEEVRESGWLVLDDVNSRRARWNPAMRPFKRAISESCKHKTHKL
jgi:hypothetical protein